MTLGNLSFLGPPCLICREGENDLPVRDTPSGLLGSTGILLGFCILGRGTQLVGSLNKSPQALLPFWSGFKLNLCFSCVPLLTRSLHCTVLLHFMASDHKSSILAKLASTRATFYLISMNLRKTARGRQKISTYRTSHLPKMGCIIPFAHSKSNNHFYLMEKYSKCMIIIKP